MPFLEWFYYSRRCENPIAPSYFTANQTVEIPKILVKYGFSGIKKGTIFRWFLRGDNQIWTGDQGVADPRLTTWLCRHQLLYYIISEIIRQDINDSYGNRTRVTAVKGRCLNRLTTEPYLYSFIKKTPRVGLEPTTARLTAACSTDWAIEE